MTAGAFFLILVSVFLHAGWNFLSKRSRPSLAFYCLASLTASIMWLPWLLILKVDFTALAWPFWALWLGSVLAEFTYFIGLAGAYRRSDISLVYPMARALPVLLTAGATTVLGIGAKLSGAVLAGMTVLSVGCLLMPLAGWDHIRIQAYWNRSLQFILLAAIGTTGYTILDGLAMQVMNSAQVPRLAGAVSYLGIMEMGLAAVLGAAVLAIPRERREFRKLFLKSAAPLFSGVFASGAYVLILLAMGLVSNVSYVQAFRQLSLPLGVLAGIVLLREKPSRPRLAGILLILIGLLLVALA